MPTLMSDRIPWKDVHKARLRALSRLRWLDRHPEQQLTESSNLTYAHLVGLTCPKKEVIECAATPISHNVIEEGLCSNTVTQQSNSALCH